jgi:hypothetical protein
MKASFPKLTTVGGGLYCHDADTKAAFPRLKKTDDPEALSKARRNIASAFLRTGHLFADSILAEIISAKKAANGITIYRVRIVGSLKITSALRLPDGTYAHGETLKEARESLLFKISNRDKSAYAAWTLDTVITKKEAIESYRVITGACEQGTRHFVTTVVGKPKPKYKVSEIITLTRGRYGDKEYAAFFTKK